MKCKIALICGIMLSTLIVGRAHAQPESMVLIGSCITPEQAQGLYIDSNYAYIADRYSGLQVIDISVPTNPTIVASYDLPGYTWGTYVQGAYLYVADNYSGLHIFDVTDPTNPIHLSQIGFGYAAIGIHVVGNMAYIGVWTRGLYIVDVTDPTSPSITGMCLTGGSNYVVKVRDNYAYLAGGYSGLKVIDVSDPSNPFVAGTYNTPHYARYVDISGNYAYVADYDGGLQIINISTPVAPTFVASYSTPGRAYGVSVSGNYAFIADVSSGVLAIDISIPTNPIYVATYPPLAIWGIQAVENFVYFCGPSIEPGTRADLYILQLVQEPGFASLDGFVTSNSIGVSEILIDLLDIEGNLIATTITNETGYYEFIDIPNGDYTVSIVTPLGYVADVEYQEITLSGTDVTADFNLTAVEVSGEQRGLGFWKHQVHTYLSGHGNAQIPQEDFRNYLYTVGNHFTNNLANPILLYTVEQPATQNDSLEAAAEILSVRGNVPMADRANQHLMALLLNVASMKLHQHMEISEDGATASQAITYCWSLLTDADDSNDELAKDIVEQINNNAIIAAGVIPLSTPNIAYKGGADGVAIPKKFELLQNFPNPFNAQTTIQYNLPEASHVTINVYDLLGRNVATIVNEEKQPGYHQVVWNSHDVSSGIFFYKIQAGDFTETKKMLLLK